MESVSPQDMSDEEVMGFLKESLPTTLLALHDISSRRRQQARKLLRALTVRANDEYRLQEAVVAATVACMAGASETIRAGVVEALGLFAYAFEDCEELKLRFLRIVLLLNNHSPQMARSIVKFLRLAIQGISDPDALRSCFDYFVKAILSSDTARAACRIRIRTLVEKLGKRFGWVALEKMIPAPHLKLFRYTKRMYNRRVRDAKAASKRRESATMSDDDDSSDEEEEICIREGEAPTDLACGKPSLVRKSRTLRSDKVQLSSDGRIVVDEDESPAPPPKRLSLNDLAELRDRSTAIRKAKSVELVGKVGGKKPVVESKRMRRKHEVIGLTQFAPKKSNSFGDSKKSVSDTDPFAYLRLNPSLVREKYKGNALQAISQVVKRTGEKASRKKMGRSGVSGGLFLAKPIFKKPVRDIKKGGKSNRK